MLHEDVSVDEAGFVCFAGERLSQADAIKLAYRLTQAVEDSVWRTQKAINSSWYHDTRQIQARADSKLGKAKKALSEVYGIRFENGQIA